MSKTVNGVYAASITPFTAEGQIDTDVIPQLLHTFASYKLTGVLLTGTTGEAPSLSVEERIRVYEAAAAANSHLTLIAGTGAASLQDTLTLTAAAFDLGLDAAAILPPFFFEQMTDLDLVAYYDTVIGQSTPSDGKVLLYHNPNVTDVHITPEVALRLRDRYPDRVIGMKNSSSTADDPLAFLAQMDDFEVLVGSDALLSTVLEAGGAGAITGAANLYGQHLHGVMEAYHKGGDYSTAQETLNEAKARLKGPPRIAAIKAVMAHRGLIPYGAVRLPLRPLTDDERHGVITRTP